MSDTPSAAQTVDLSVVRGILQLQDQAAKRRALNFWTIYDKPKDYPHGICARRHEAKDGSSTPTDNFLVGDLQFLRDCFRGAGLVCICRQENDDAKIIETWI